MDKWGCALYIFPCLIKPCKRGSARIPVNENNVYPEQVLFKRFNKRRKCIKSNHIGIDFSLWSEVQIIHVFALLHHQSFIFSMRRNHFVLILLLSVPLFANAQIVKNADEGLLKFVSPAPDSVFKKFRDAGMDPTNHELTTVEKAKIEDAFKLLPPLHRKILGRHLHSISFMDNMPNTALTSPVESKDN
jgi:hypothetical protein